MRGERMKELKQSGNYTSFSWVYKRGLYPDYGISFFLSFRVIYFILFFKEKHSKFFFFFLDHYSKEQFTFGVRNKLSSRYQCRMIDVLLTLRVCQMTLSFK